MVKMLSGHEAARQLLIKLRKKYGFRKEQNFCGIQYVADFQKDPYRYMRFFIQCLGEEKSDQLLAFDNKYFHLKGKSINKISLRGFDDYRCMENDFLSIIDY